ncbi:MAG: hypothetical protein JWL64_2713, partial [Frankiales bacterium]|nr:hypothetical protein [Frankiales bacterium]
ARTAGQLEAEAAAAFGAPADTGGPP